MSEITNRLRRLEITLTDRKKKLRDREIKRVSEAYPSDKITDEQRLYIVERITLGLPIVMKEVLKLKPTQAAELVIKAPAAAKVTQ